MNHDDKTISTGETVFKPVTAYWLIKQVYFQGVKNKEYENPWYPWAKTLAPLSAKLWTKLALKDEATTAEPIKRFITNLFWEMRREINQAWKKRFDLKDTNCLPGQLKDMVDFYLQRRLPTMIHDAMKAHGKARRADWNKDEKKWKKEIEEWQVEQTKWSNMIKLACENPGDRLSDADLAAVKDLVDQIRSTMLELKKQLECLNISTDEKKIMQRLPKDQPSTVVAKPVNKAEQTQLTATIDSPPGFELTAPEFPQLQGNPTTVTCIVEQQVLTPQQEHVQIIKLTDIKQLCNANTSQTAPLRRLPTADPTIFLLQTADPKIFIVQTPHGMFVTREHAL